MFFKTLVKIVLISNVYKKMNTKININIIH